MPQPKPDYTPDPPAQLRIRAFFDAADLRRPDKAIFRELLHAFDLRREVRGIAWDVWSFADHRTGETPRDVTPARIAEVVGWSLKRVVYRSLRELDDKAIVFRARDHWRDTFRFVCNIRQLRHRRILIQRQAAKFGVTLRDSKLPFGVTERDNLLERSEEIPLIAAAVASPSLAREQQQQDRELHRAEGICAAIAARARGLGYSDVAADCRGYLQDFKAGKMSLDRLQEVADELGEKVRESKRRVRL